LGEKGEKGAATVGNKGAVGATGEQGEKGEGFETTLCTPESPDYAKITLPYTVVCSSSANAEDDDQSSGAGSCSNAFDGDVNTEWYRSGPNQAAWVKVELGANYHVVRSKFHYRDAMSDRTGSVTVESFDSSGDVTGTESIGDGLTQSRDSKWGPHSLLTGTNLKLSASGGNPWMDGENFGIQDVEFYGCPA